MWADRACAAPPPVSVPSSQEFAPGQPGAAASGPLGFLTGIRHSGFLFGNLWGLRTWLSQYGISLAIQETSEELGNLTGGVKQGFEYDGLTQMVLQMDTQRAFGWYGGTFNVSALQVHGNSLSADHLGTLQTASGIEADRATRLWELWYQQKFGRSDRFSIRLGQQSLDQEFMVSQNASYFVNTMFGWPMLPSADLPGGGPAYPLSAPGVRLQMRPTSALNVLTGVFSGSPLGTDALGDPQQQNPSGTTFPLNGTLALVEFQYSYPSLGTVISANEAPPLGRTYKLGFWYDTKGFPDQEFDDTGLSLASPASSGTPRLHRGDWAVYGVVDQILWESAEDPDRTLSFFLRPMGTPLSDRNLIDFSLNAGITLHDPFEYRDEDIFALGMGYAHVSGRAADFDRDAGYPERGGETYLEVTYQYQVTPWWVLQPDFQYVFDPGAGYVAGSNGTHVGNEAVLGVRTNIIF